ARLADRSLLAAVAELQEGRDELEIDEPAGRALEVERAARRLLELGAHGEGLARERFGARRGRVDRRDDLVESARPEGEIARYSAKLRRREALPDGRVAARVVALERGERDDERRGRPLGPEPEVDRVEPARLEPPEERLGRA